MNTLTPEQHHEDCDYRVSRMMGDEADCNLDCAATAMELPHITREELFMLIVGLEHLRDDSAREANRDRSRWASQEFAREDAARWRADSVQAEHLRQRLIATPNYRMEDA